MSEQLVEQPVHWKLRHLRFIRAYYLAIIHEAGLPEGDWLEMYKDRLAEIEEQINGFDNNQLPS